MNLGALTSVLPIFYPPTQEDELHSEPRADLKFFIIDSHRPWDLNNVFLKEGGVFCVDDGDIESGLAVEGGVGEDYEVLLEVIPLFDGGLMVRGIRVMMLLRGRERRRRFCVRRMKRRGRNMRRQLMRMENAVDHARDHARNQDQVPLPKKTIH